MNCSDFRDRLDQMLDGLLPPEEADHRQTHIAECGDCAAEVEEAQRFRSLLDGDGAEALSVWHARRLAARAAADAARDPAPSGARRVRAPAPAALPPLWRRAGIRYAAAASILAAGLVIGAGMLVPNAPPVLAAGLHTLYPGEHASTGSGRSVEAARMLRLSVEPGFEGRRVAVNGGAGLFDVAAEQNWSVSTPRGIAQARGAVKFLLEVRQDDSVALTVLTGELQFEADEDATSLVAGDRLEVDETGASQVVNRDRVVELELAADVGAAEATHLREQVYSLERELKEFHEHVASAPPAGTAQPASGEIPWREFGRATRDLLVRRGPASKERRMSAMGVLLVHSEAILEATGAKDPREALTHPVFVAGIAPHFVDALAPTASVEARAAATRAILDVAEKLRFALERDPLPTEGLAAQQRAGAALLRAIRRELGDGRAAEVALAMPRGWEWDVLKVRTFTLSENTVAKILAFWTKRFELEESQQEALRPFIERYVEDTLAAQETVVGRFGEEQANSILFPDPRWGGLRELLPNGDRLTGTDCDIVDNRLTRMEARLELAPPRIALEHALKGLLRDDQLTSRSLATGWGLPTFRPAPDGEH